MKSVCVYVCVSSVQSCLSRLLFLSHSTFAHTAPGWDMTTYQCVREYSVIASQCFRFVDDVLALGGLDGTIALYHVKARCYLSGCATLCCSV
jgi:hypothetical protein